METNQAPPGRTEDHTVPVQQSQELYGVIKAQKAMPNCS